MHVHRFTDGAWNPVQTGGDSLQEAPDSLRIVTYNVHFKGGTVFDVDPLQLLLFVRRMQGVVQLIREQDADVVCLQEVTGQALKIFLEDPFIQSQYYTTDS